MDRFANVKTFDINTKNVTFEIKNDKSNYSRSIS